MESGAKSVLDGAAAAGSKAGTRHQAPGMVADPGAFLADPVAAIGTLRSVCEAGVDLAAEEPIACIEVYVHLRREKLAARDLRPGSRPGERARGPSVTSTAPVNTDDSEICMIHIVV
ncbi:hypothetical protein [Parafrankia elaeagni]|uniref:hypothetical protein n=1 Tax=Parafrankia elaeagni TaxID=222534 RepID=UPI000366EB5F|nr:hypothetical protein [Parafrankia elaeagni]